MPVWCTSLSLCMVYGPEPALIQISRVWCRSDDTDDKASNPGCCRAHCRFWDVIVSFHIMHGSWFWYNTESFYPIRHTSPTKYTNLIYAFIQICNANTSHLTNKVKSYQNAYPIRSNQVMLDKNYPRPDWLFNSEVYVLSSKFCAEKHPFRSQPTWKIPQSRPTWPARKWQDTMTPIYHTPRKVDGNLSNRVWMTPNRHSYMLHTSQEQKNKRKSNRKKK